MSKSLRNYWKESYVWNNVSFPLTKLGEDSMWIFSKKRFYILKKTLGYFKSICTGLKSHHKKGISASFEPRSLMQMDY